MISGTAGPDKDERDSTSPAVEETTRLLDAFGEPDEEAFRTAVEKIDERVLGTVREFFSLMRQRGATLRVVAGDRDNSFGAAAVARLPSAPPRPCY